jgi:hypothetical protein
MKPCPVTVIWFCCEWWQEQKTAVTEATAMLSALCCSAELAEL